ncbi:MAG: AAA family ATPase [Clostridia bacterium]|nr:AAA family ATPase [Clostridia bacterium]
MKRIFEEKLIEWKEKNITIPLMVVGARQIGKTYLIDKFCRENFKDYIYINLIDNSKIVELFEMQIDTEEKVSKLQLILNKNITEDTVVFFDEIQ